MVPGESYGTKSSLCASEHSSVHDILSGVQAEVGYTSLELWR